MSILTESAHLPPTSGSASRPLPQGVDLTALVAAKLCHDFISPSGAVMSGLDLLDDPTAQDMRDDALNLIRQSAAKMIALVNFARVAFGASTSAETFSTDELHALLKGLTDGGRAQLDWRIDNMHLSKSHARTLLNLAYLTVGALPMGGTATLSLNQDSAGISIAGQAEGSRVRLKAEAIAGLQGLALNEGLHGQWIQPYWLWLTINEAGGRLDTVTEEGRVSLLARLPKVVQI